MKAERVTRERVTRLVLTLLAVVLAVSAPLRAWCEADCLAPAHAGTAAPSHCQPAEPDNDATSMSALVIEDCPTVETARPIAVSKPVIAPALIPSHPGTTVPGHQRTSHLSHPRSFAPSHPARIPLRI